MFNYKYITTGNKVICLSTFAGKTVRGVAKCAPNDTFDEEKGKDLATARCAAKVAQRRYNRAVKKVAEAQRKYKEACDFWNKMIYYKSDAECALNQAKDAVAYYEERL